MKNNNNASYSNRFRPQYIYCIKKDEEKENNTKSFQFENSYQI